MCRDDHQCVCACLCASEYASVEDSKNGCYSKLNHDEEHDEYNEKHDTNVSGERHAYAHGAATDSTKDGWLPFEANSDLCGRLARTRIVIGVEVHGPLHARV